MELDVTIVLELVCEVHKHNKLDATIMPARGVQRIIVTPCQDCLDDIRGDDN